MKVRDGMTTLVLTIGPAHTLREAARLMSARRVGAAVVIDPEQAGVGIMTERDILDSLAAGQDPDTEVAAAHRTLDVVLRVAGLDTGAGRGDHGPGRIPAPGGGRR